MVTLKLLEPHGATPTVEGLIEQIKSSLPHEFLSMIEETLPNVEIELNKLPYEKKGISKEMMEDIYRRGYALFQSGRFHDALLVFNNLSLLVDLSDPRYILAMAATYHQMKKYEEAAGQYLFYQRLNPQDPLSYYHLYDCLKQLNQPEAAISALKTAKKFAGDQPKYADLKAKVDLELAHLQAQNK